MSRIEMKRERHAPPWIPRLGMTRNFNEPWLYPYKDLWQLFYHRHDVVLDEKARAALLASLLYDTDGELMIGWYFLRSETSPEKFRRRLIRLIRTSRDPQIIANAYAALDGFVTRRDKALIHAGLQNKHAIVRFAALWALKNIATIKDLPLIVKGCHNRRWLKGWRGEAANALCRRANKAQLKKWALDPKIDAGFRSHVIFQLTNQLDEGDWELIERLLGDKRQSLHHERLLSSINRFIDEEHLGLVRDILRKNRDYDVFEEALKIVCHHPTADDLAAIDRWFSEIWPFSEELASNVAAALEKLALPASHPTRQRFDAFDREYRDSIYTLLCSISYRKDFPLARQWAEDPLLPRDRMMMMGKRDLQYWLDLFDQAKSTGQDYELDRSRKRSIQYLAGPASIGLIRRWATYANPEMRELAMAAIEVFNTRETIDILRLGVRDKNRDVRAGAFTALYWVVTPEDESLIAEGLRDPYDSVRREAVASLARIVTEKNIHLLQAAMDDADDFVRWEAAWVLEEVADRICRESLLPVARTLLYRQKRYQTIFFYRIFEKMDPERKYFDYFIDDVDRCTENYPYLSAIFLDRFYFAPRQLWESIYYQESLAEIDESTL